MTGHFDDRDAADDSVRRVQRGHDGQCADKSSLSSICNASAANPGAWGGDMHANNPVLSLDAATGCESTTQFSCALLSSGQIESENSPPPSARTLVGTGPSMKMTRSNVYITSTCV
eukprot:30087-Pelagococcus_subviridis.AAC.14